MLKSLFIMLLYSRNISQVLIYVMPAAALVVVRSCKHSYSCSCSADGACTCCHVLMQAVYKILHDVAAVDLDSMPSRYMAACVEAGLSPDAGAGCARDRCTSC